VLGRQLQIEVFDTQDWLRNACSWRRTRWWERRRPTSSSLLVRQRCRHPGVRKYPVPFFCVDGSAQTNETIAKGDYWNCFQLIDGSLRRAPTCHLHEWLPTTTEQESDEVGSDDAYDVHDRLFAAQATHRMEVVAQEYVPTDLGLGPSSARSGA